MICRGSLVLPGSAGAGRDAITFQQLDDPFGVLADRADVAEHPLGRRVVLHGGDPHLPIDVPEVGSEALHENG